MVNSISFISPGLVLVSTCKCLGFVLVSDSRCLSLGLDQLSVSVCAASAATLTERLLCLCLNFRADA